MTLNAENIAQHLIAFGYTAKPGTITDKKTGEAQSVVFVNGLGSINAYLNLSEDPTKFGLKVFGNLQDGYAPVVFDTNGQVLYETVHENGKTVTRSKRGERLDPDSLKRKNNEISLTARKDITAAVLAAYMLEVGGGDLEKIRDGFRLQKWERPAPRHSVEAGETETDASAAFSQAATPQATTDTAPVAPGQGGRRVKRAQSSGLKM